MWHYSSVIYDVGAKRAAPAWMTLLFRTVLPPSFFMRIAALAAVLGWSATAYVQSAPAVIEAVKARDLNMAGTLIEEGADVNAPQGDGATALH